MHKALPLVVERILKINLGSIRAEAKFQISSILSVVLIQDLFYLSVSNDALRKLNRHCFSTDCTPLVRFVGR